MNRTLEALLLVVLTISAGLSTTADAQIKTQGSTPLSFRHESLRSPLLLPTLRLGAFDQDSARMEIELNQDPTLRTRIFAQKQRVNVDIISVAYTGASDDQYRVWQYRVTSPGAKSIGLLFEDFHLPSGALLFVYSADKKQVIGGFGAVNNNQTRILPIQPIFADDIVIEVVAPASGATPTMRLTEVNHALYDLRSRAFGQKYGGASEALECTPEVICVPNLGEMPRSVVALLIDGVGLGTGSMINNTKGDRRPLLLTASHVISANFRFTDYERRSSLVQAFFNFQSPSCSGEVQPQLNQSISGAKLVAVDQGRDVCLIELNNTPPDDYQVYYAGWNAEPNPQPTFTNIHHPELQPKSVNVYYGQLKSVSFPSNFLPFEADMHWEVPAWDMGTTALGSSGSPLFDRNGRIVGALSGGNSYCSIKASDYFFSLNKVWDSTNPGSQKVVQALDPSGAKTRTCDGLESSAGTSSKFVRISHITEQRNWARLEKVLPQLSQEDILGESYGNKRIAERYELKKGTEISGLYIVFDTQAGSMPKPLPLENPRLMVFIDGNDEVPLLEQEIDHQSIFRYSDGFKEPRFRELYVPFAKNIVMPKDGSIYFALNVDGFYGTISVVHKDHSANTDANTFYRHVGGKTIAATEVKEKPISASLWIDPVVYSRDIAQQAEDQPLVKLSPIGNGQVIVTFAPRVAGKEAHITMYSLLGQKVYEQVVTAKTVYLDRYKFEGRGILVMRVECGGEKSTLRVLFPAK